MTRKERERAEAERKRRWKVASAVRSFWSEQDQIEEAERLEVEKAELLAAGIVTVLPVGYAKGFSANSLFSD